MGVHSVDRLQSWQMSTRISTLGMRLPVLPVQRLFSSFVVLDTCLSEAGQEILSAPRSPGPLDPTSASSDLTTRCTAWRRFLLIFTAIAHFWFARAFTDHPRWCEKATRLGHESDATCIHKLTSFLVTGTCH